MSLNQMFPFGSRAQPAYYGWLNNCLKWFYFNSETTKLINSNILKKLNNFVNFSRTSYRQKARKSYLDSRVEDIYFKSVETLPPKFTNIQTIVTATDSLTLKASLDFSNIEIKADLKKAQCQLDFKIVNSSANVLIVLSQNRNHLFNMDCSIDPESEMTINIKCDQDISPILEDHIKYLIQEAAKQTVINLELNFLSKRISPNSKSAGTQLNMNQNTSTPSKQTSSIQVIPSHSQNESINIPANGNQPKSREISKQPSVTEKRLLVKLIKATNLTNCDEPYCVVELDYPMQKHITDIQEDMSTIDEQFLFDVIENSEELTFSVYDRAKDYGNDLVGEAVLPVADLCSSMNSKRMIQLHRYGHTKTGSITVEFIFIEPEQPQKEDLTLEQARKTQRNLSHDEQMNFANPRLLNPEILSNGSYSSPAANSTQSAPYATQQLDPNEKSKTLGGGGRVINRNYLQIQAENYHNRASSLTGQNQVRSRLGTSQNNINSFGNNSGGYDEPKRTRSISRSVRNLFNNTKSKRDKSYDSNSVHNANSTNYDVNSENSSNGSFSQLRRIRSLSRSVRTLFTKPSDEDSSSFQNNSIGMNSDTGGLKKSKSIGRSIKKLFTIGKGTKYEGSVRDAPHQASPARSSESGPSGSQTVRYTLTPQRLSQTLRNSQQNVNMPDQNTSQQRVNSILLKRDYKAP